MQYKCENNVIEKLMKYLSPLIWGELAMQLLVIVISRETRLDRVSKPTMIATIN